MRFSPASLFAFAFSLVIFTLTANTLAQQSPPAATPAPPPAAPPSVPLKTIELEWDAVENAGSYEVKLTPEGGGEPLQFKTPENRLSHEVPIGNYDLQVRALSADGQDASPWSERMPFAVAAKELTPLNPEDGATLDGQSVPKVTVEFKWTPVDKVKLYTLVVWNEDKKDKPWVFTTKNTSKKLDVPAAQVYYWQVKFESADAVTYQQQPKTFSFTLLGSALLKPEIQTKMPARPESFRWRSSPQAQEYEVKLSFRHLDESEWKTLRADKRPDTQWTVGSLKPGVYRLEVTAKASRRAPSATAVHEFTVKPSVQELDQALRAARL
jgi:hypothetical protein